MVRGNVAAQRDTPAYGKATFVAALANTLLALLAGWIALPWFLLLIFVVPLLLVDLAVAAILKTRGGILAQVGQGMMIGMTAAPIALALFVPGFLIAQGLGLV
jgi:hypothetical protein